MDYPERSSPAVASKARDAKAFFFGGTWQEVTTRVEAFVIEATDRILSIQNIAYDQTRASLLGYHAKQPFYVFVLRPGEHIVQAEVCYTDEAITALKFTTNHRATPWFGKTQGAQWRLPFGINPGSYINAFHGKYGPSGCSELGVVYTSKRLADEGHLLRLPSNVTYVACLDDNDERGWQYEYRTFDHTCSAIIITTGECGIEHVRVATRAEYRAVTNSDESFEGGENEHWLVLGDDEYVQAVAVHVEDQRIQAIAFKTNHQTSHCFGEAAPWTREWLSVDDMYICGFELGVVHDDGVPVITALQALCVHYTAVLQHPSSAA